MRWMVQIAAGALALCIVGSASAKDCEAGASNMAEVRACLAEQQTTDLDAALSRVALLVGKNKPAAAALRQSQASWLKFVEDSCSFSVAIAPSDAYPEDVRTNCRTDFTAARIKILQAWSKQLGPGR